MKAVGIFSAICILVAVLNWKPFVNGQTFQYSRGWTNGKRSDTLPWTDPQFGIHFNKTLIDTPASLDAENDAALLTTENLCSTDRNNVIILTRDRMLQLIAYSMRKQKFINVVVCVDPVTPSTHMHVDF